MQYFKVAKLLDRGVIFSVLAALSLLSSHVVALEEGDIQKFIATLPEINQLAEGLSDSEEDEIFSAGDGAGAMMALATGEFSIYQSALRNLADKQPQLLQKLTKIVSSHGYSSTADWAKSADEIVGIMVLDEMSAGMASMGALAETPEFELPPEMQQAFSGVKKAVAGLDQSDVALVRKYKQQLTAYLEE